jgi:transcriptional regulator with XRE-family HTH domain
MGEKIKYVRELRNMTLATLSEQCGLSSPYLSDIENGKKNPSTKSLEKIAKALNADAWFFLDDKAVTFEELTNVSKINLPDDLMAFIADQKNLPYIVLAKQLDDEGIPHETLVYLLQMAKSMKK